MRSFKTGTCLIELEYLLEKKLKLEEPDEENDGVLLLPAGGV